MNFTNAVFEKAYGTGGQLPVSDLPEICFCGRSNVGKSSLINKIFGRKSLARVSTKPGKTVTVNFYRLNDFRLVDLPGYGYAKIPKEELARFSELMEEFFKSGRNIKMVFQLVDIRHPLSKQDSGMINFLRQMELPFCIVLTKADKLNVTQFDEKLNEFEFDCEVIPSSAADGRGIERMKEIIENMI